MYTTPRRYIYFTCMFIVVPLSFIPCVYVYSRGSVHYNLSDIVLNKRTFKIYFVHQNDKKDILIFIVHQFPLVVYFLAESWRHCFIILHLLAELGRISSVSWSLSSLSSISFVISIFCTISRNISVCLSITDDNFFTLK